MRRTFRKHPKIVTTPHQLLDWVIGNDGGGPYYDMTDNSIHLCGVSEKVIVEDLNHEMCHWAVFAFLTQDEILDFFWKTMNWQLANAPRPLIEEVARFVAGRLT